MNRVARVLCGIGWGALAVLVVLALMQDQGQAVLMPGTWSVSLVALALVAVLIAPGALLRAVPAAALAVLLGGLLFSTLPDQSGQDPVNMLLAGTGGAALVVAPAHFAGRRDAMVLAEAMLAGALHAGLLQVLTVAPMVSPFVLWPWLAPVLLLCWPALALVLLGLTRLFRGKPARATPRTGP